MQVNKIDKKYNISRDDLIRFQVITELIFFHKEHVIASDIELICILSLSGPMELGKFCNSTAKKLHVIIEPEEFSIRSQNIRNRITKLLKRNIVVKVSDSKKIMVNPKYNLHTKGNILLNYNMLSIESN